MNENRVDEMIIKNISINNLNFDDQNPRLPSSVDGTSQAEVIDWMLKDVSIIELMGSIGEHGYFIGEPLLIVPDKLETYIVIEGNRRLAAVKLLADPGLASKRKQSSTQQASIEAKERPVFIPCVIYNNRKEILAYLGYRHITGIKTWGALAKAKYLKQLSSRIESAHPQNKFRELAKIIGSRSDYVARLLSGLAVYEKISDNDFFDIKDLDEESINFSLITTAMNYSNIADFLGLKSAADPKLKGLDINNLKLLTEWTFWKNSEGVTRLGESRNLKSLNAVVASKRALPAFIAGKSLIEAAILTEEPLVTFRTAINESRSNLETARDCIHLVDLPTKAEKEILFEIRTIATDLRNLVITRLHKIDE